MYLSKNESAIDGFERLKCLFPNRVLKLLRETSSKDLIPVDPIQEESIVSLINASNNIYVRSEDIGSERSQSEYSLSMGAKP